MKDQRVERRANGGAIAFLSGALMVVPVLFISLVVSDDVSGALYVIIQAPLIEELAKLFPLLVMHRWISDKGHGALTGALVGLGFGMAENIGYLVGTGDIGLLILRSFTTMPLHVATASLLGYGLGSESWRSASTMLLFAFTAHFAFNTIAFLTGMVDDRFTTVSLLARLSIPLMVLVSIMMSVRVHSDVSH